MDLLVALALLGFLGLAQSCPDEEIATNIARYGEASQISTFLLGTAVKAIDGNKDPIYKDGFCCHTDSAYSPWWKVDLKRSYKIVKVVVTGRNDAVQERLLGAQIRIGNSSDNNNPVCGTVTTVPYPLVSFCCTGMIGQYVSVVIPGRTEFLSLCEVEVYSVLESPPC